VAKRVRGSRSAHRPGGQGPARVRRAGDAAAPTTGNRPAVTPQADIDEAIESVMLETTEITIEESDPVESQARPPRRGVKVKADSLQARVAAENVYVREDLRRIGTITLILLGALVIAWVLFVVLDLLELY
jgi:hypothetical protein